MPSTIRLPRLAGISTPFVFKFTLTGLLLLAVTSRAAFFWTNAASGNWSAASSWTNDTGVVGAPDATGQSVGFEMVF